ncbi:MAG: hypothetical protein IPH75_10370 [bacterium]|nr:hypothetical protein [bacterium]
MISVTSMMIAEQVIHDRDSNRISVINIFDGIAIDSSPLFLPQLTILTLIERSNDTVRAVDCSIDLRLDDDLIFTSPLHLEFGERGGTRSIVRLSGVVLPRPGTLKALFSHQGQVLSSYLVRIDLDKPTSAIKQI